MRRLFLAYCLPFAFAASTAWAAGPVASAELPPLPPLPAPGPPAAATAPASATASAPAPGPASASGPAPASAPGPAPDVVVLQAPTLATHDAPVLDTPPPPTHHFYESGWFWGALGAAALIGGAIYLATQDTGSQTIHLQVQVPH
jgi:hypothetical protein